MTIAWESASNGQTTGTSHALTKPTVNTGDLLFLWFTPGSDAVTDWGDWTPFREPQLVNVAGTTWVATRIIDGTEGSTLDFTTIGSTTVNWTINRFSSTTGFSKYPIRGLNHTSETAQSPSALAYFPGCWNSEHTGMTLLLAHTGSGSAGYSSWPSGYTERMDVYQGTDKWGLATSADGSSGLDAIARDQVTANSVHRNVTTVAMTGTVLLREKWTPGGTATLRPLTYAWSDGRLTAPWSIYQRSAGAWSQASDLTEDTVESLIQIERSEVLEALMQARTTTETNGDSGVGLDPAYNNGTTQDILEVHLDYPPDDMDEGSGAITQLDFLINQYDYNTYADDSAQHRLQLQHGTTAYGTEEVLTHQNSGTWVPAAPAYGTTHTDSSPASITLAQAEDLRFLLKALDDRNMGSDAASIALVDFEVDITYDLIPPRASSLGYKHWGRSRVPLHIGALY